MLNKKAKSLRFVSTVSWLVLATALPAFGDDGVKENTSVAANTAGSSIDTPQPSATSMTATIQVNAEQVTLGDLFDNAPATLASKAVMSAPAAGESMTVSAYQLKRIALDYGIAYDIDYTTPLVTLERVKVAAEASAKPTAPLAVAIIRNPVINGAHIRLGDIFEGYFSDASVVISEAPEPGKVKSLSITDVKSLAALHGLNLKDTGSLAKINVRRAGTRVTRRDIETLLIGALTDFGFANVKRVSLAMEERGMIYIPVTDSLDDIYVSGFALTNPKAFKADLIVPTGGPVPKSIAVTGGFTLDMQQASFRAPVQSSGQSFGHSAQGETSLRRINESRTIPALEAGESPLTTVQAKADVLVAGTSVSLVDLFDGVPDDIADKAVLEAPKPGTSVTIQRRLLERIASDEGLDLELAAHINSISIHREGIRVSQQDYLSVLKQSLGREGIDDTYDISLQVSGRDIFLPADKSLNDIRVDSLEVTFKRDRFTAVLSVPTGQYQPEILRLTGRLLETREVPVLSRSITPGEVIGVDDVTWTKIPLNKVTGQIASDPDQLIGKTVQRSTGAGDLLKTSNLKRPMAIKRNTPAVMTLNHGLITLSTTVKALTDGASGDLIRVENLSSGQVVDARVTGPGRVEAVLIGTLVAEATTRAQPRTGAGSR